jgi:integrase
VPPRVAVGLITVHRKFYRLGKQQLWGATKTHRQYAVSIPQVVIDELTTLRKEQNAQRELWGDHYKDHGLVFCQPNGQPLHERNISRRDFRNIMKRVGLPRIRLYDLRGCNATHLAEQGTPIHVVQRRLGHSNPATTLRYYTHVLPDAEREAATKLAARFAGDSRG